MRTIRKAGAIFDDVLSVTGGIGGFIVIFLMLIVCAGIVYRYFLQSPLLWVMKVGEISLVYFTFLVTAWVLRREAHVKMDLLLTRLKPKNQALVNVITSSIAALIFLIIVWYGSQATWKSAVTGFYQPSFLEIPNAFFLFIIPLGSFLLSVQFLRRAYRNLMVWRDITKSEEPAA